MRKTLALIRKELLIFFTTPTAYAALSIFVILSSFFFLRLLGAFQARVELTTQKAPELLQYLNLTDGVLEPLYLQIAIIFIFVMPFLSMRLFAEERRLKTYELLLVHPISITAIALGKYLAALIVLLAMVGLSLAYPCLLAAYADLGRPSWNTVACGLLGLTLCGGSFLAVGMFLSSLTQSQALAASVTFCVLLLLWMAGWAAADQLGFSREVLLALSAIDHVRGFTRGAIELSDVVYFLSLIGLGVFFTCQSLELQRIG